jgi:biopolymer transport protein ExbB/TolQ
MNTLSEIVRVGGPTLLTIVLLSMLATFVLVERLVATAGVRERVRTTADSLMKLLYQGQLENARTQSGQEPQPIGSLFSVALQRAVQRRPGLQEAMERERAQFNQWLRNRLWMLGTIAASAPFIGLFGTVLGIIKSFNDIAETGGGGFAVVSRGLSEALITTAAGIIVAVEAVVFYNFLQAHLGRIAFSVRLACEEFVEVLDDKERFEKKDVG